MTDDTKFQIRRGCPNDFGYIQRNWLESLREDWIARGVQEVEHMAAGDFMKWAKARTDYVLTTDAHKDEIGDVVVRVAHRAGETEEDLNALMGFIVAVPSSNVLHYLYVAPEYRGGGVARELMETVFSKNDLEKELRITHLTAQAIHAKGRLNLRYLPL